MWYLFNLTDFVLSPLCLKSIKQIMHNPSHHSELYIISWCIMCILNNYEYWDTIYILYAISSLNFLIWNSSHKYCAGRNMNNLLWSLKLITSWSSHYCQGCSYWSSWLPINSDRSRISPLGLFTLEYIINQSLSWCWPSNCVWNALLSYGIAQKQSNPFVFYEDNSNPADSSSGSETTHTGLYFLHNFPGPQFLFKSHCYFNFSRLISYLQPWNV